MSDFLTYGDLPPTARAADANQQIAQLAQNALQAISDLVDPLDSGIAWTQTNLTKARKRLLSAADKQIDAARQTLRGVTDTLGLAAQNAVAEAGNSLSAVKAPLIQYGVAVPSTPTAGLPLPVSQYPVDSAQPVATDSVMGAAIDDSLGGGSKIDVPIDIFGPTPVSPPPAPEPTAPEPPGQAVISYISPGCEGLADVFTDTLALYPGALDAVIISYAESLPYQAASGQSWQRADTLSGQCQLWVLLGPAPPAEPPLPPSPTPPPIPPCAAPIDITQIQILQNCIMSVSINTGLPVALVVNVINQIYGVSPPPIPPTAPPPPSTITPPGSVSGGPADFPTDLDQPITYLVAEASEGWHQRAADYWPEGYGWLRQFATANDMFAAGEGAPAGQTSPPILID